MRGDRRAPAEGISSYCKKRVYIMKQNLQVYVYSYGTSVAEDGLTITVPSPWIRWCEGT